MFSVKLILAYFLLAFGAPVLVAFGYEAYLATPSGSSSSSGSIVTVYSSSSSGGALIYAGSSTPLTTTRGVPGPIAGAGLPVLAVGCGVYWLVRRRRPLPA